MVWQRKNEVYSCREYECIMHILIKITDSILDVVFSRFMCVTFTITLRPQPKGVKRSRRRTDSLSVFFLRRLYITSLGCCLRVVVNVTHRNLEKTTSCVLSVILIHLWYKITVSIRPI